MGARRTGREAALQILYGLDASASLGDEGAALAACALYWRHFDGDPEGRAYADAIVTGVARNAEAIDARIKGASAHWRIERMARVDRGLLRLGAYELEHLPDVPRPVILDEAVELAKAFGSEESSAFVNGVLNKIADLTRGAAGARGTPPPPAGGPRRRR